MPVNWIVLRISAEPTVNVHSALASLGWRNGLHLQQEPMFILESGQPLQLAFIWLCFASFRFISLYFFSFRFVSLHLAYHTSSLIRLIVSTVSRATTLTFLPFLKKPWGSYLSWVSLCLACSKWIETEGVEIVRQQHRNGHYQPDQWTSMIRLMKRNEVKWSQVLSEAKGNNISLFVYYECNLYS
jgi:hypothetical protein